MTKSQSSISGIVIFQWQLLLYFCIRILTVIHSLPNIIFKSYDSISTQVFTNFLVYLPKLHASVTSLSVMPWNHTNHIVVVFEPAFALQNIYFYKNVKIKIILLYSIVINRQIAILTCQKATLTGIFKQLYLWRFKGRGNAWYLTVFCISCLFIKSTGNF